MVATHLVRGPWRKCSSEHSDWWAPPSGTVGLLDTRTRHEYDLDGPPGEGLFWVTADSASELPRDEYTLLTVEDPRDAKPDQRLRDALPGPSRFTPSGDTLAEALFDTWTMGADPDQDEAVAPIMPTAKRQAELVVAGACLYRERFKPASTPYRPLVLRVHGKAYLGARDAVAAGKLPPGHHLRMLDELTEQWGVRRRGVTLVSEWRTLIPAYLRRAISEDAPTDADILPHQTELSDDFNREDQTELGGNWPSSSARLSIASNRGKCVNWTAGYKFLQYGVPLSSANHRAEVVVHDDASILDAGGVCRADASGGHAYGVLARIWSSATRYQWYAGKWSSGSWSSLTTGVPFVLVSQLLVRCQIDGTTLSAWIDNSQVWSGTDSSIQIGVSPGIGYNGSPSGPEFDDWSAEDLVTETFVPIGYGSLSLSAQSVSGSKRSALGVGSLVLAGKSVTGAKRTALSTGSVALRGVQVTQEAVPRPFHALSCPHVPRAVAATRTRQALSVPFTPTAIRAE